MNTLYHISVNFSTARVYKHHHLGTTSTRRTFPAQATEFSPGFSTGKPSPVTVSFLRTVSLKQFMRSLSISMYSSTPAKPHELVP